MQQIGMEKGEALSISLVNRALKMRNVKWKRHNFDIRKQLLEYDDVANEQRKVIYQQRDELLAAEDIAETIAAIRALM